MKEQATESANLLGWNRTVAGWFPVVTVISPTTLERGIVESIVGIRVVNEMLERNPVPLIIPSQ